MQSELSWQLLERQGRGKEKGKEKVCQSFFVLLHLDSRNLTNLIASKNRSPLLSRGAAWWLLPPALATPAARPWAWDRQWQPPGLIALFISVFPSKKNKAPHRILRWSGGTLLARHHCKTSSERSQIFKGKTEKDTKVDKI